jgi:DNA-binding MarR family transcriptional regulator
MDLKQSEKAYVLSASLFRPLGSRRVYRQPRRGYGDILQGRPQLRDPVDAVINSTSVRQSRIDLTAASQAILSHWRDAVPDDRLAHLVKDAFRGLSRSLQIRLSEHSVLLGHWTILRILWEEDGLTQSELSERSGLMQPTVFSALKAMERLGYIRRSTLPDSRKKVYISLTPAGRALKGTLVPAAEEVNARAVSGIKSSDIQATRRTLLAMICNLAGDEAEAGKNQRYVPSTQEMARIIKKEKPAHRRRRPRDPQRLTGARAIE